MKPVLSRIIALFLFLSLPSFLQAKAPVVKISPKPAWISQPAVFGKKPNLRGVRDGYFLSLIDEQTHIEKKQNYTRIIREIVSEAGIQNASEISVDFDPSYESLNFHEVTVWRDNKPLNRLKLNAFKVIAKEEDLSRFIYEGTYSALLILDDIRKGDRIEYSYTLTGTNPILGNHFARDFYLQGYSTIAHIYKRLVSSTQRHLNFKYFNNAPKPKIVTKDGFVTYQWDRYLLNGPISETNEPSWFNAWDYVQISDFKNWKEVVDWASAVNPTVINFKGELADRVKKLKAGNPAKDAFFREAVKLVQNEVRYMGIEIGEYSHRANNPEKVYRQRYGDCKDKALLLVSILQSAGIKAYMALVNTDAEEYTAQFLPSSNVFDHAIAVAYINGKQVWVDATMSNQGGAGTNIHFPDYEKALILAPETTGLADIPRSTLGKTTCRERFTITDKSKPVTLEVTTTYTRNQADNMRSTFASQSRDETEKNYLNYYLESYPDIEAKDTVRIVDDKKSNTLTVYESYLIKDFFNKDSVAGTYNASFYANYIHEQLPEIRAKRKHPVYLNFPFAIDYTLDIILPGGWTVDDKSETVNRDEFDFSFSESVRGDTLSLNYQFAFLKGFIAAEKAQQLASDFQNLKDNFLSFSFNYNPDYREAPFKLNYGMVIFSLLIVLITGALAFKIYYNPTEASDLDFEPRKLGGWIIWKLIGFFASIVLIIKGIAENGFYTMSLWNAKANTELETEYHFLVGFELFTNIFLICFSVFCIVLMLQKRDILPRIITIYLISTTFLLISDNILSSYFLHTAFGDYAQMKLVFQNIISCCIWIPYFQRSQRVRETFVNPYPPVEFEHYEEEQEEEKILTE